jgi:hypothetical protein
LKCRYWAEGVDYVETHFLYEMIDASPSSEDCRQPVAAQRLQLGVFDPGADEFELQPWCLFQRRPARHMDVAAGAAEGECKSAVVVNQTAQRIAGN